jgi:LPS export ABC transporter protein LptC
MHNGEMLKKMIKRVLDNKLAGIAITLTLATLYITFSANNPIERSILNQSLATSHYLSKAIIKISDATGTFNYQVSADQIIVLPDRNASFTNITFNYKNYTLVADKADLNAKDKLFTFREKVNLSQDILNTASISTEELLIDLIKDMAYTDSLARINYNNGYILSNGLSTDFNSGQISLLDNIYGEFYR